MGIHLFPTVLVWKDIRENQHTDASFALLLIKFQDGLKIAYENLVKLIQRSEAHTIERRALYFLKATRVFDARQKSALPRSLLECSIILGFENPAQILLGIGTNIIILIAFSKTLTSTIFGLRRKKNIRYFPH